MLLVDSQIALILNLKMKVLRTMGMRLLYNEVVFFLSAFLLLFAKTVYMFFSKGLLLIVKADRKAVILFNYMPSSCLTFRCKDANNFCWAL